MLFLGCQPVFKKSSSMLGIINLFIMLLYCVISTSGSLSSSATQELNNRLLDYDVRVRPKDGEGTLNIGVMIDFISFGRYSEKEMEYDVILVMHQTWEDKRLEMNKVDLKGKNLTLSNKLLDKIWIPDTTFSNDKHSRVHSVTKDNSMLRVQSDGTVHCSFRISSVVRCPMDLVDFPMDQQNCSLIIQSSGNVLSDVSYFLLNSEDSLRNLSNLENAEFYIVNARAWVGRWFSTTGVYSKIAISFTIRRYYVYYIGQTYLPCSCMTLMTMVAFWIDEKEVVARISVGASSILGYTIAVLRYRSSILDNIPWTALDVYIYTCLLIMTLIISAIGVTAWAVGISNEEKAPTTRTKMEKHRNPPSNKTKRIRGKDGNCDANSAQLLFSTACFQEWVLKRSCDRTHVGKVDRISQIFFPSLFLFFNIGYWIYYIHV